jgi:hypothetical protein
VNSASHEPRKAWFSISFQAFKGDSTGGVDLVGDVIDQVEDHQVERYSSWASIILPTRPIAAQTFWNIGDFQALIQRASTARMVSLRV